MSVEITRQYIQLCKTAKIQKIANNHKQEKEMPQFELTVWDVLLLQEMLEYHLRLSKYPYDGTANSTNASDKIKKRLMADLADYLDTLPCRLLCHGKL